MNPLLVVTNEAAGSTDDERVEAALAVLRSATDVRREVCAEPGDLDRLLDGLGDRMLVVVGGDGSVHTAVATLHARGELSPDRPIGLVPLGTGNDLARTLGVPLDPAEAAQALRRRPTAAAGPGGRRRRRRGGQRGAPRDRGGGRRQGRGAQGAAGQGGVRRGQRRRGAGPTGWHLRGRVDGVGRGRRRARPLMVAVANGRTIGGGAELAPGAEPDDGLLDVVVATSTGPLARLGFGVALREGEHVERDDVLAVRGREVTVHRRAVPAQRRRRARRPGHRADLDRATGCLVARRPGLTTSSGGSA